MDGLQPLDGARLHWTGERDLERNWLPFSDGGQIRFMYAPGEPLTVLEAASATGECHEVPGMDGANLSQHKELIQAKKFEKNQPYKIWCQTVEIRRFHTTHSMFDTI